MFVVVKFLQFVGCANVCFVALNSHYRFSSDYFSNTTLIVILLALVVLSFSKEIFSRIGTVTTESKPVYYFFRFITVLIPGILSSLVVLIPKLILIESQHMDSMMVRFTVKITRLWDKSELASYLTNLVEERGILKLVSDIDQNRIVENSNSMSELRSSLNALVNERLELLRSEIPDRVIEVQTVVQEPSWFSENIILTVTVSVIAIVALAGIGYLLYTNSGSFNNSEPTTTGTGSIDDSNLRDIEARVAEISALVKSNPAVNVDEIVEAAINKVDTELSRLDATVIAFARSGNSVIKNTRSIDNLSIRVNNLSKSINELTTTVGIISKKTVNLETSMKNLRANADKVNQISEDAFLNKTMQLVDEKIVDKATSSGADVVSNELSGRLDVLSKKLNKEALLSRESARRFSDRVGALEKSNSSALETNASFVKIMVDAAKEEILGSSEFVAMGILMGNETIREMLVNEEVKNLIGDIKKKG